MSLLLDATCKIGGVSAYEAPLSLIERLEPGQLMALSLPAVARVQLALRAHSRNSHVVAFIGTPNGDAFTVEQILYREQVDGLFHYLDLHATSSAPGTKRIVIAGVDEAEFAALEIGAQFNTMHGVVMDVLIPPNRSHLHAETDFDVFMQLLLGQNPGEDSSLINPDNIQFGAPVNSAGTDRNTDVVLTAIPDGELQEGSRTVSYNRITLEDLVTDLGGEIDDLGDEALNAAAFARAISALTGVRMRADAIVVEQLAAPVEGVLTRLATIHAADDHPVWMGETTVTLRAYPEVPDVPPLEEILRVTRLDGLYAPGNEPVENPHGENISLWLAHQTPGSLDNDDNLWTPNNRSGRLVIDGDRVTAYADISGYNNYNLSEQLFYMDAYGQGYAVVAGQTYFEIEVGFEMNTENVQADQVSSSTYLVAQFNGLNEEVVVSVPLIQVTEHGDGSRSYTSVTGRQVLRFVAPESFVLTQDAWMSMSLAVSTSPTDTWSGLPAGGRIHGTIELRGLGRPPAPLEGEAADVRIARYNTQPHNWRWRDAVTYTPSTTPIVYGPDVAHPLTLLGGEWNAQPFEDESGNTPYPALNFNSDGRRIYTDGVVERPLSNNTSVNLIARGGGTLTLPTPPAGLEGHTQWRPWTDEGYGIRLRGVGVLEVPGLSGTALNNFSASLSYGTIQGYRGTDVLLASYGGKQSNRMEFSRSTSSQVNLPENWQTAEHHISLNMGTYGFGNTLPLNFSLDGQFELLVPELARVDAKLTNAEFFDEDSWNALDVARNRFAIPARGTGEATGDLYVFHEEDHYETGAPYWNIKIPDEDRFSGNFYLTADLVVGPDFDEVVARVLLTTDGGGG